jgi:hypothetical protein
MMLEDVSNWNEREALQSVTKITIGVLTFL